MVERYRSTALAASFDSYRIHPLMNQLFIEDIKHFKERTVC